MAISQTDRVLQQLRKWRDDLVNLSRRNRLLYFNENRKTLLEVIAPRPAELVRLLQTNSRGGLRFSEPPDSDSLPAADEPLRHGEVRTNAPDATTLRRILKRLERASTQELLDKGLNILYVAVGLLRWQDSEDQPVASPLLLIPVAFRRDASQGLPRLTEGEDEPSLNPALALKLESDFGVVLPSIEGLDEPHVETILRLCSDTIRGHRGWSLEERAFLSTFSFHKEVMYRDLKDNEPLIASSVLIRSLVPGSDVEEALSFEVTPEDQLDEKHPPEALMCIRDADASQRQAIVAARSGRSFVLDGPPGTGKSQTISNIIAELMAQGKSVLFVSEKAPALEVVSSRLTAAGLEDFVLELHSHKATRRKIAESLGRALRTKVRAGRSLPEDEVQRLASLRRELSEYARAVNQVRPPLGRSLHEILGVLATWKDVPQAPPPEGIGADLEPATASAIKDAAASLGGAWGPVARGQDFAWRGLRAPQRSVAYRAEVHELVQRGLDDLRNLVREVRYWSAEAGLPWNRGPRDAVPLLGLLKHLVGHPEVHEHWLTTFDLDRVATALNELEELAQQILGLSSSLEGLVGKDWRRLDPGLRDDLAGIRVSSDPPASCLFSDPWTSDRLRALADQLEHWGTIFRDLASRAPELVTVFGLDPRAVSLQRASRAAALAALAMAPDRPEAEWLNPVSLARARAALEVLHSLVNDWRDWQARLGEVFKQDVVSLDLESLCVRFEAVHKGLRRLLPAYWRDRKIVASCTLSGRASRRELSHLREALEWKRQTLKLRASEADYSGVLGTTYYRSTNTDFDHLLSALSVATQAVRVAGSELHSAALARQLALGTEPDQTQLAFGEEVQRIAAAWNENPPDLPDAIRAELSITPLEIAAARCEELRAGVLALAKVCDAVSEVAGRPLTASLADEACRCRAELVELQQAFMTKSTSYDFSLGPSFRQLQTNWGSLHDDLAWCRGLRERLGFRPSLPLATRLLGLASVPTNLESARNTWEHSAAVIHSLFEGDAADSVRSSLEAGFQQAHEHLRSLADSVDDIVEWADFVESCQALQRAGLGKAVTYCIDKRVPGEQILDVMMRCVYVAWAEAVIAGDQRLRRLKSEDRDHCVEEFRTLDSKLTAHAVARIVEACGRRRPNVLVGAASTISREAEKQRRHMPTRRLLEETAPLPLDLKPCFMMSPLSVSSFLPPGLRFDVVIFDEASQVRPADAIGCIYRATQLIVAGDQKQLPPTSFFELGLSADDEWDEDQLDEFDSILDTAKASGAFTAIPLRWHYRSQHEDLITYSNYSFYDGKLVTFPGACIDADDLGVEMYPVKGVYRRGGPKDNPAEAEKVMERVLFHTRHHPNCTIGVVAFSEAQASTIEAVWERWQDAHPEIPSLSGEDPLSGPFVKNLETVQGDERDIIVFSVGYGPDENGKFTMNFGPINVSGGQRRLNVAITRARRRIEVVSSVRAGDFRESSASEGVRHLKRFLDFAERKDNRLGALGIELGPSGRGFESPFEEEVAGAIRSWGYDVLPQVGCAEYRIDLGVRHPDRPGEFAIGVECDGAMYHSSRVARDRDRLRAEVLRRLGWTLHRVWGPSWYRSREREEERLRSAIQRALHGSPKGSGRGGSAPAEPIKVRIESVEAAGAPEWVKPYKVSQLTPPRRKLEMHDDSAQFDLRRMIREVVEVEGPVHEEVCLRRIRRAWGVERAGSRIRAGFDTAVRSLTAGGQIQRDRDGFLREVRQAVSFVRAPNSSDGDSPRNVKEVPADELALAVMSLAQEARSIDQAELVVAVARLFGWERVGSDIEPALVRTLAALVKRGELRKDGSRISCSPNGAPSG